MPFGTAAAAGEASARYRRDGVGAALAEQRYRSPYPNSIPWASGNSSLQLMVTVWRRM